MTSEFLAFAPGAARSMAAAPRRGSISDSFLLSRIEGPALQSGTYGIIFRSNDIIPQVSPPFLQPQRGVAVDTGGASCRQGALWLHVVVWVQTDIKTHII